jgi:hypothetical protein
MSCSRGLLVLAITLSASPSGAVLSQDIFRVPVEDLPKTESVLTMVSGQIAFASGAFAKWK